MERNVEEIKTKRELYKAYIDEGVPPEELDSDRKLHVSCVSYTENNLETYVDGGEAENIKDAAALVQKFINEGKVFSRIIVRKLYVHDSLLCLRLNDDGVWVIEK